MPGGGGLLPRVSLEEPGSFLLSDVIPRDLVDLLDDFDRCVAVVVPEHADAGEVMGLSVWTRYLIENACYNLFSRGF